VCGYAIDNVVVSFPKVSWVGCLNHPP